MDYPISGENRGGRDDVLGAKKLNYHNVKLSKHMSKRT